jgi:hypothetical protein
MMEPLISQKQPSHRLPYSTQHLCLKCGIEFFGRMNQLFCSKECKIKFNNDNAAKKNRRVSEQMKMLKMNAEILEELYSAHRIPFMTEKEELIRKGFIMNCPTIRLKADNGTEWHLIGDYIFRPENEGREIAIMTKNDLEKI